MGDAREIIAQQVRCGNVDRVSLEVADSVIDALTASGYIILSPDDALEQAAKTAETGYWSSAMGNAIGPAAIRKLKGDMI